MDKLVYELRAKDAALDGQDRPAAVLWTDPDSEWLPLIETMRTRMDELLTLGEFVPDDRMGPAIWIRCVVDGALDTPKLHDGHAPIVYLPGVARQELRAGEGCRDELRPLVELMYRGTLWLQHNGSDWGVSAFLSSTKTLQLEIGKDRATQEALLRALPEVALTPVSELSGRRLDAEFFDRMLSGDVVRDLLRWMGDAETARARLGENGWGAFCSRCKAELGFDPDTEADVVAGAQLGKREGAWQSVWERFCESPTSYGDVAGLLRRSRSGGSLPFDREPWPDLNDQDEAAVRRALEELPDLGHDEACAKIAELEAQHGGRRGWVWSKLDLAPMAKALEPLSRLAVGVKSALGGATPDEVAGAYLGRGWQADAASWEALAVAQPDDPVIARVVSHLLTPWLDDSARAFQAALVHAPLPIRGEQAPVEALEDGCLLFADGLRYDLGQRLAEMLEGSGCRVTVKNRWAATPSVTSTGKPAVTPVADGIVGDELGEDFGAKLQDSKKPANAPNLRAAMTARGYQVLGSGDFDAPMSHPARGWLEFSDIDSLGHKLSARLAEQISVELDRLTRRILGLLDSGWKSVRVVTDHGWLLLPGGLPKVDLPKHLTASRWARCAVLSGASKPNVPTYPWYWNASRSFASAPGIACFNKSEEYAHGGLSPQECLIPDIVVEKSSGAVTHATIASITWRGLRCFVEVKSPSSGVTADLRQDSPTGGSVVATAKPVEADGSVSLVLRDDEFEQADLVLVLVDSSGTILAQAHTRVGADS